MNSTNYKKLEQEFNELKKEHLLLKNDHIKFKKEQKNKFRKFVIFMVVLCLIISGITGVASYTIAAGNVAYTPRDNSWTVENTEDAINELRDTIGGSLVGSIYSYMGTYAPFGYLACDGSEYNIADYPRLAEHINRHFGSYNKFGGDGTTTFAVPDLRGEFLRGSGTNSHTNQGSGTTVGVHQDATKLPGMYGSVEYSEVGAANTGPSLPDYVNNDINKIAYVKASPYNGSGVLYNTFTTRPTNTSVLYIIKY